MTSESAEERKRKRLEAWRKRREQNDTAAAPAPLAPLVKVSLSLNAVKKDTARKSKKKVIPSPKPVNPFGGVDDDDDESVEDRPKRGKLSLGLGFSLDDQEDKDNGEERSPPSKRRKGRWDAGSPDASAEGKNQATNTSTSVNDTLDKFMDKLQAGALGNVATQVSEATGTEMLSIDVGGSMMRVPKLKQVQPSPLSGGVITPEQLAKLSSGQNISKAKQADPDAFYTPSDWESDGHAVEVSKQVAMWPWWCVVVNHYLMLDKLCFTYLNRPKQMTKKKRKLVELSLKP